MAEARAEAAPAPRTYEEIFRQSGLAWRAYIAIFVTEFAVASTWASYCFINLFNVRTKTCVLKDIYWPIIILLCSMKFFAPWFESWNQSYVQINAIQPVSASEPNIITYKKAMTTYIRMKWQLLGYIWLFTISMWVVWTCIAIMGLMGLGGSYHFYVVESALHIPLGLFAAAVSTFFRYLNKHIYWNEYSDAIYDSISQVAKATCLVVNSLCFIRVTVFLIDPFWTRFFIAASILLTLPMTFVVCSGNHFGRPPAKITVKTEVQESLPVPAQVTPPIWTIPSVPLAGSLSYDDSRMLNQTFQRLPNTPSHHDPDKDENSLKVEAMMHGSPKKPTRPVSSPPRMESNDIVEEACGTQQPPKNLDRIEVVDNPLCSTRERQQRRVNRTRPGSSGPTTEASRQKTRYNLLGTGVYRKHQVPVTSSNRSPGPVVKIDTNVKNPSVRYQAQGGAPEVPSSSDTSSLNPKVTPVTETEANSSTQHKSKRGESLLSLVGSFFSRTTTTDETTKDESSRTQIPELKLETPNSPGSCEPLVGEQDTRNLSVKVRTRSRRLSGTQHPDSNQLRIDFEKPEPEPTQLETSAVLGFQQSEDKCKMRKALPESVNHLIKSLRRSFSHVWFWYDILSTALSDLFFMMFLMAYPNLALHQHNKDFVAAGDTLLWIGGSWLAFNLGMSWLMNKLQELKAFGHIFGTIVYVFGIFIGSWGMMDFELPVDEEGALVPWAIVRAVAFGVGLSIVANLRKTMQKFLFLDNSRSSDDILANVNDMARNAECGISMVLIVYYSIYYYLYAIDNELPPGKLFELTLIVFFILMLSAILKCICFSCCSGQTSDETTLGTNLPV